MNISIDGYCDHTLAAPDDELMDYFTGLMDDVDLLVYGRIMFQLMFPYWADVARDRSAGAADIRFADRLTAINKIVFSRTLNEPIENGTVFREDPVGVVRRLKEGSGQKISIDSVSMLPLFIAAGLIDEFHFVIHPVIAGGGKPLLQPGSLAEALHLKLANKRTFQSGCVALHYTSF